MMNKIIAGVVCVVMLAFLLDLFKHLPPSFLPDLVKNGSAAIRGG